MARPRILTKELGTKICARIAKGESLRKIDKDDKMPSVSSIIRWLVDDEYKWFRAQYEAACNTKAEVMFDELLEIADNTKSEVMRDRLRVDTRKWYLSKIMPKKFGDKMDVTSGGKPIPLLANVPNVQQDDSSSENTEAPKEN